MLQSTLEEILTRFTTLRRLKNLVAGHFERNFDIIFHSMAAQNLVEEHYERVFDTIFHFKVAQKLVAEHNEK